MMVLSWQWRNDLSWYVDKPYMWSATWLMSGYYGPGRWRMPWWDVPQLLTWGGWSWQCVAGCQGWNDDKRSSGTIIVGCCLQINRKGSKHSKLEQWFWRCPFWSLCMTHRDINADKTSTKEDQPESRIMMHTWTMSTWPRSLTLTQQSFNL